MATQAISKDYGTTVSPDAYVSGIMVHIWLPAMYELMIEKTIKKIRSLLSANPTRQILIYDLGCGPGHFTLALAQRVAIELRQQAASVLIVGIDNSPVFVNHAFLKSFSLHPDARRLVCFEEYDVFDIKSQSDIITVSGFVHHFSLDDQVRVLNKMASLLMEGGVLIHGDEHPAPYAWFEKKFPGFGRTLSTCTLYFQVIANAYRTQSHSLMIAEIENFIAEVYRDDPDGVPQVEREMLIQLVKGHARQFMEVLVLQGLEKACRTYALPLFDEIKKAEKSSGGNPGFFDRGDFKVPLQTYVCMVEKQGFQLLALHDTGDHLLLGSAPVLIFEKN